MARYITPQIALKVVVFVQTMLSEEFSICETWITLKRLARLDLKHSLLNSAQDRSHKVTKLSSILPPVFVEQGWTPGYTQTTVHPSLKT